MRSFPFAMTFDMSDEYSVLMSESSNVIRFRKPITSP
jgi:hypothetical protein